MGGRAAAKTTAFKRTEPKRLILEGRPPKGAPDCLRRS